VLLGGAAINLAIAGVWVLSRTAGVPIGPNAGTAEPVGFPDSLATGLEVAVALGAVALAVRPMLLRRPLRSGLIVPGIAVIGSLALVGATAAALTPRFAGEHHGGTTDVAAVAAADGHDHGGTAPATGTDDTGAAAAAPAATDDHHGTDAAMPVTSAFAAGTSPCELSGPPVSENNVAVDDEGHAHRGPTEQVDVDAATRAQLQMQQEAARQAAAMFPTVAHAEAAGYHKSTPYVPCIGAHYTNVSLVAVFDPLKPSELLYDGTEPDSKIVGLSYLVFHPGGEPEGFAGPNDHWHQHNSNGGLCLDGALVVGAEDTTPEECAARGGRKVILEDIWMLHDWVVPGWECSWGVFAPECPELGGTLGADAFTTS
jgi:hypothetical protein